MTEVALALPTLALAPDERELIDYHLNRLGRFELRNKLKADYYEGRQKIQHLGISVPASLLSLDTVVGWPGTTVDVLEERLDWQGWAADDGELFGLDEAYAANGLDVDASLGMLDALIYGTSFVVIGAGGPDDPHPLITVESARRVTGEWDGRTRRLASALSVDEYDPVDKRASVLTLYRPAGNVTVARNGGGPWRVVDRDEHQLGRTPVVQLTNRPRASRVSGRSEITRAVRAYTDQAIRTLLGMEVNREFYSAPQRWVMGVDEGAFTSSDGTTKTGWEAVVGRVLAMPKDEDGDAPTVGQFTPASPTPYLEQVRGLSQLLAAEAAIPSSYLGFVTENPSSADAIRQAEARLLKRAERRQTVFGRAWREVGAVALLTRDGAIPPGFTGVTAKWRDAATPTRSAAADEAVKLIGAGVLAPDSSVTYDRVGLSPAEARQVTSDRRRAAAASTLTALSAAAEASRTDPEVAEAGARRGPIG